jgi:hypothetical protein
MLLDFPGLWALAAERGMVDNAARECNSNLNDIPRKPRAIVQR